MLIGKRAKITAATLSSLRLRAIFIIFVLKLIDKLDPMIALNLLSSTCEL